MAFFLLPWETESAVSRGSEEMEPHLLSSSTRCPLSRCHLASFGKMSGIRYLVVHTGRVASRSEKPLALAAAAAP